MYQAGLWQTPSKCLRLTFVAFLVLLVSPSLANAMEITSFLQEMHLRKDSSLDVSENILVDFTKTPSHEFYRILPIEYYKAGKKHSFNIRILNVCDEHFNSLKYSESRLGEGVNVCVSKPESAYTGRHIFRLHYLVRNAFSFDNRPELLWKATGNNWTSTIGEALVKFIPPRNLKGDAFDFNASCVGNGLSAPVLAGREYNDIIFRAHNIQPGSGLDINIAMPKSSLSPPGKLQQMSWFFQDWWASFLIPLPFLLGLGATWWVCGVKGGAALVSNPNWRLTEHLTPAELGTILDGKCYKDDLAATLIDLAIRGYIEIEEIKLDGFLFLANRDYIFTSLKPIESPDLSRYERMMLSAIFVRNNDVGQIKKTRLSELREILPVSKSTIYRSVYEALVNKGQMSQAPDDFRLSFYVTGAAIAIVGAILFVGAAQEWQPTGIGIVLAGCIFLLFAPIMPVRTINACQSLKNSLVFFRSHLGKDSNREPKFSAQENDISWRFLPYAMVLGLADQWIETFQDLIKEPPSWYKPYYDANGGSFSCRAFVVELGNGMKTLEKAFWSILICSFLYSGSASQPSLAAENLGSTGSVTITRHVNEAAKAFAAQNYAKARDEYRIAIGMSPDTLEFYYGLYDVCVHSGEWDQVAFALNKIFSIDPSKKRQLGSQYGEALYQLGRYDEAVPVLKQALKDADLPMPKISLEVPPPMVDPVAKPDVKSAPPVVAVVPETPVIPPRPKAVETYNPSEGTLKEFTKTFQNAAHSECIVTAEYLGYEKSPDIQYYHPPLARYHITKILKGPPLNRDLPIRYEFHDRSNEPAPPGWKFGPDKMPKKGSEWILFIKIALPRENMFDTYEGDYGRQPKTEENLNKIYALLENATNR